MSEQEDPDLTPLLRELKNAKPMHSEDVPDCWKNVPKVRRIGQWVYIGHNGSGDVWHLHNEEVSIFIIHNMN